MSTMSSLSKLGWPTGRKAYLPYHTAQPRPDEEKPSSSMTSIQEILGKMPDMSSLSSLGGWLINRKVPSIPLYTAQPHQDNEKSTTPIISLQEKLGKMPTVSSLIKLSFGHDPQRS